MSINRSHIVAVFTVAIILISSVPVSASSGEVIQAGDTEVSSYVPITIDGSYEDWADKPHTDMTYPWDPNNSYHSGAIFRDETNVYLHIRMSPTSYTQFNGNDYRFNAESKGLGLSVQVETPKNVAVIEGNNALVVYNQNNYKLLNNANGYLTRQSGQPDEWEIRISLDEFPGGIKNVQTISFTSPNIGGQTLYSTGTPTLPYIIAGGGLVIAVAGYQISRRKRKKA